MSRRRRRKKGTRKSEAADETSGGLFDELRSAMRVAGALRGSLRLGGTLFAALVLAVLGMGAVYGLELLNDRLGERPEFHPPLRLVLHDPPEWVVREDWAPRILSAVTLPDDAPWSDGELMRQVHRQLMASGWVSAVNRVWQEVGTAPSDGPGTGSEDASPVRYVRVDCAYRRPIAMVSSDGFYVAVDREGYRLPGDYPEVTSETCGWWLVIRGITGDLPTVGACFSRDTSPDAVEAIRLATVLSEQGFAPRLQSIDVSNFRGRRDRFRPHIAVDKLRLPGDPPSGFYWGSAIGEEVEELAVEDKLRNIGLLLAQGKPLPGKYLDVSTLSGVMASFDAPMASAQSARGLVP